MTLLPYFLKIFFVHSADGDSITSEFHHQLAVTVYSDDIAFVTLEQS